MVVKSKRDQIIEESEERLAETRAALEQRHHEETRWLRIIVLGFVVALVCFGLQWLFSP